MLSGNKPALANDNLLVTCFCEKLIVASHLELLTPALLSCSISAGNAANDANKVETELGGFIFFCAMWFIRSFKIIVAFLLQVLKNNF